MQERRMDEETRRGRELDALENIAAEVERLRILREHELGVRGEDEEGTLRVMPVEDE
jgi:hypothetical protein